MINYNTKNSRIKLIVCWNLPNFPYTTVTCEVHDRVKIKTILITIVGNQIYDNILSVINYEK